MSQFVPETLKSKRYITLIARFWYRFLWILTGNIAVICTAFAVELPPIIKHYSSEYMAGNQNWKIAQDADRFLYFANNEGLLEFNGAEWTLYPSPNETIIRAVKVVGNKVYTGCYNEFGYWKRQPNGQLKYISLSQKIKYKLLTDEHVWEIQAYEDWVLFQTLHRIYLYNTKTGGIKIVNPDNGVWRVFLVNNAVYFQTLNEGLYQIINGTLRLISDHQILKNYQVCAIFQKGNDLLLQTEKEGLFSFLNGKLTKYGGKNSDIVNRNDIFSCIKLNNGNLVMGTISDGIFILSDDFDLRYHMNQHNGLSNNTALSLFEDIDKNLWIGLDNGINCVNLNTSLKCFVDNSGLLGTVYASKLHHGILYLGTNQGLFYKNFGSGDEFQLIKGTKGQVWTLFEYQGTLFCGHNRGTLIIHKTEAKNLFSQSGTWKFSVVPGQADIILAGHYNGLSVIKNVGGKWVFYSKIKNFDISSRYFEIDKDLFVYISHEYKGIIRIRLDKSLTTASNFYLYSVPAKGKNAALVKINQEIIFASREGFYKLDYNNKTFVKDRYLNTNFKPENYISGKMTVDKSNKLWVFTSEGLSYFYLNNIEPVFKQQRLYLNPGYLKSISGYENIEQLNDQEYLIGTTDGFFIFNFRDLKYSSGKIRINEISVMSEQNKYIPNDLHKALVLHYKSNNIKFSFSIPKFNKYIKNEYQYYLEGYNPGWTSWQNESSVVFRKLNPGNYTFHVKGRQGNDSTISSQQIAFKIKKAPYATNLAIFLYTTIFLCIAFLVNRSYARYYAKQESKLIAEHNLKMEIQQLENDQELMKLRNMELSQHVDDKNKELAVSNLDLIHKNELLKIIKDDIKKHKNAPDLIKFQSLLSGVNEDISGKDSWETFKKSFDSVDKDFLKRLHAAHPSLSPGELKLCAYLRLNLVSKEIAPLLNISARSVEIKRYRLRKKLNLQHDSGLSSYLINF